MQALQAGLKEKKGPSKTDTVLVNLHKKSGDMRVRLEELRDHLMQLRDNVGPDRHNGWYSFLEKYDAINKSAEGLVKELKESLTQGHDNFVSVPIALTADPAELPDFLRTKLEPDIERDFDSLHNSFVALQQPGGISGTGATTTTSSSDVQASKDQQRTDSATAASGSGASGSAPAATSSTGQMGAGGDNKARAVINAAVTERISLFNEMIEKVLDDLDGKRLNLSTPWPSERPAPVVGSASEAVLAALMTGQGLTHASHNSV